MNIFKSIGTVLQSLTNMIVEVCQAGETLARTVNETAGIAEDAVKQLRVEQGAELAELQASMSAELASKDSTSKS